MKKLMFTFILVFSIGANSLFANPVKDFVDSVAYGIFKTAWPTAIYKDVEIVSYDTTSSGYDMVLKFHGNSRMCVMGSCPLWFTLDMQTDKGFVVEDYKLLKHNAIMQPPFKTSGSLAKAMLEASHK